MSYPYLPESCYRHPAIPADAQCRHCHKPICAECAIATGGTVLCPACLTQAEALWYQRNPDTWVNPYRGPLVQPFVTWAIIALIGGIWLLLEFSGGSTNPQVLVRFGAMFGPLILQEGEVWRLFTAIFLHIGLTHLLFNSFALYVLGRDMEALYGHARFLAVFLLSGLFGSLTTFALRGGQEFSAGASGGVFGIVGMTLGFFWLHRNGLGEYGKERMKGTLQLIAINIIIGVSIARVNNAAHMGGLVAGVVLGWLLAPRLRPRGISADGDQLLLEDAASLQKRLPALLAALALFVAATWWVWRFWLARSGLA